MMMTGVASENAQFLLSGLGFVEFGQIEALESFVLIAHDTHAADVL
jgi:hypothetical protein